MPVVTMAGLEFTPMLRFFNTTGPCNPADHYMLPPTRRVPDALQLVERKQFFVLRVVNGGGHVEREFAAGRGAIDLVTHYGADRFVTEIKRVRTRDTLETAREKGIAQLERYLDTLGLTEGWLLVVDQRANRSWEERMWQDDVTVDGRLLHLVGA